MSQFTPSRHAGLDPASRSFAISQEASWTPDQVRGDENCYGIETDA